MILYLQRLVVIDMEQLMQNEYRYNRRFADYVDRFAAENNISVYEALKSESVKRAWRHYTDV